MSPFFSILIPVFNQEKLMDRCIDSLKNQTFQSFEVIAVDDCSTDDSVRVFEGLTAGDKRFRIIKHEKNRSVLEVRKTGFAAAQGAYILSVDIDDYLDTDALERIHGVLREKPVDVLTFALIEEPGGKIHHPRTAEDPLRMLLKNEISPSLPQKVIKKEVIKKACRYIRDGYCNMAEDYYISAIIHTFAGSCAILDEPFYHYIIGVGMCNSSDSLSLAKLERQVGHIRFSMDAMRAFLLEHNPDYAGYVEECMTGILEGTLWQYCGKGVSWSDCFRYINYFNSGEYAETFLWACNVLLPERALLAKEAATHGK
jgi:glycosyltransferase involved in cell wall biosynthesis